MSLKGEVGSLTLRPGLIALGMGAVPAPGGLGDRSDIGELGRPAQLLDDPVRAGDECCGITGSPTDDLVADWVSHDGLAGVEDLEHADAGSRAEVVRPGHPRFETLDG